MLSGKIEVHDEPAKTVYYGTATPINGAFGLWDEPYHVGEYRSQPTLAEWYQKLQTERDSSIKNGFVIGAKVVRAQQTYGNNVGIIRQFANTLKEGLDTDDQLNPIGVAWQKDTDYMDYVIFYNQKELILVKE